MLWALMPGTQFQPLAHYFVALLFTSSMPLWWALVDQAHKVAGATAPQQTEGYAAALDNHAVRVCLEHGRDRAGDSAGAVVTAS